ncbi:MAG: hypothetical protein K2K31_01670 [Clostridia bacterium]|nr:hypothetical protein [Clostridia bacterium]
MKNNRENSIYFVTTNKGKLASAQSNLSRFGITLNYVDHEVTEPNINDIEYIATYKVKEAYQILKKPCITLDSGFYIPHYPDQANFPGAFPKRELLEKIGIDGLLEKMKNTTSRECYFKECVAYYDGKDVKYFYGTISGTLSTEIRKGNNPTEKWSELWYVFIPEGFDKTMAEMTEQERESLKTTETDSLFKFANWFSKQ